MSLVAIANAAGIRINVSDSIARGLWITTPRAVAVGAYVLICPPPTALFGTARERGYLPRGHCPGGFAPLMKQVVAIKGDQVDIAADGCASTAGCCRDQRHASAMAPGER